MTTPIRLRTRSLKIVVSEADAVKIVTPLVNVTAYILSIHNTLEMPQVQTFAAAVKDSKTRLAALLSNALLQKVDPQELSSLSVEVIPHGGYFKVHMVHHTHSYANAEVMQGFKVSLTCKTKMPLLMKLQAIEKHLDPERTSDEVIGRTIHAMKRMGL